MPIEDDGWELAVAVGVGMAVRLFLENFSFFSVASKSFGRRRRLI
jgi:hypothetical protein